MHILKAAVSLKVKNVLYLKIHFFYDFDRKPDTLVHLKEGHPLDQTFFLLFRVCIQKK